MASNPSNQSQCRFCGSKLEHVFVDLGMSPLCQTHIEPENLNHMEPFYPLLAYVCGECFLVQLDEYVAPDDIFANEYAYFSSFSDSWVEHARKYVDMMVERYNLGQSSKVMEIASNDGYLLQHVVNRGIQALGIEPAANCAAAAKEKGIESVVKFFGAHTAKEIAAQHGKPDVLLGNNVLAHVPDINDFVSGMKILLKDSGVVTMEFPHLYRLIERNQFDTIYHEHFSYLSFYTVEKIFAGHGLTLFDVQELKSHGGSIRIFARHTEYNQIPVEQSVYAMRQMEIDAGFASLDFYSTFGEQVKETKRKILEFLIQAKRAGKTVVGYGAPGKGNTLLNYCGIRTDFLDYTVDRSPHKQGRYTPGTHIPILAPEKIFETKPDYVFILPWNLEKEISASMAGIAEWGGKFVVPIPEIKVLGD